MKAIKSDTHAQHRVKWERARHDDKADIVVYVNGAVYPLKIKSGRLFKTKQTVLLSGSHRLGRYNGDLQLITNHLNSRTFNIILATYHKKEEDDGFKHVYQLCYLDIKYLQGVTVQGWQQKGKQFVQTNQAGVLFSLRPSMSWRIWQTVPTKLLEITDEFMIG